MTMNQNNSNKNQNSSSVWFLLGSVASVTLFFKTDFYDPFNSAKLILLLVLVSWIFGHIVNSYKIKAVEIRSFEFLVLMFLLFFILSLFISTMMTDSFIVGLIGEAQRRNGFLSYLGLCLILLYASRSINFSNIDRVYKVGILTGVILSTYGVIQISGRDFVAWDNPYSNMISTLGNPNFASALLAILVLMSLYSFLVKDFPVIYKVLSFYLVGSSLVAIVISGSRQGLLVIFFSLLFYFSILSYLRNKLVGICVSVVLFFVGFAALLGMLQKGPLTSLLYKDSVSVRGYYWRAGIEMFRNSPLSGVGVDRYGVYFKEFREVSYPLKYGFEITSTNAHNTFIQLFATAGVFVGFFYLMLMFLIFISGVSLLRQSNSENQKIVLGLLATWVGFQAQSLISIDNIGISIWGWLLGGTILGLKFSSMERTEKKENSSRNIRKTNLVKLNLFQPMISLVVLVPTLIFVTNFYKIEQNLFILKGISNPAFAENKQPVLQYVNKVLSNPLTDPFYKYRSAFFLYDMGFKEQAFEVLLELATNDPLNPDFLRGKVFVEESRNNIEGVISAREQISNIDPWNADNLLQLLKLYKAQGDLNKAIAVKEKIFSFAQGTKIAYDAKESLG
jgi:O-antigen ligase